MVLVMGACAAAFYYTLALPSPVAVQRLFTTFGVIPAQVTGNAAGVGTAYPVICAGITPKVVNNRVTSASEGSASV